MSTPSRVSTERARRPKDRKAQIARASAEAFSELGYHGVSMEDIAGRVGVTATSLYRHYSGKYEIFQAAVLGLGQQLVDCTAFLDEALVIDVEDAEDAEDPDDAEDPRQVWDRAVAALIDTALANRTSGGLYRWEWRYLDRGGQMLLNEQIHTVNHRLQLLISRLRPDLSAQQPGILSTAVLSAIGSVTDHRAVLPTDAIHATLAGIARVLRDTDLPRDATARGPVPRRVDGGYEVGEYEQILYASMCMFNERGYHDTGMDDIAAAVDIATTSIYRFFSGKAAILTEVYRRTADRVSGDLSMVLATAEGPRAAVIGLADAFITRSFANPEVARVYYAEFVNVPAEDRVRLSNIQRAVVGAWAHQVAALRPEISLKEARFIVHAGFALVVDLHRDLGAGDPAEVLAVTRLLVLATLLGDSAAAS